MPAALRGRSSGACCLSRLTIDAHRTPHHLDQRHDCLRHILKLEFCTVNRLGRISRKSSVKGIFAACLRHPQRHSDYQNETLTLCGLAQLAGPSGPSPACSPADSPPAFRPWLRARGTTGPAPALDASPPAGSGLPDEVRAVREGRVRRRSTPRGWALRCRVVPACARGAAHEDVAARTRFRAWCGGRWRARTCGTGLPLPVAVPPGPGGPGTVTGGQAARGSRQAAGVRTGKRLASEPVPARGPGTGTKAPGPSCGPGTAEEIPGCPGRVRGERRPRDASPRAPHHATRPSRPAAVGGRPLRLRWCPGRRTRPAAPRSPSRAARSAVLRDPRPTVRSLQRPAPGP